MSDARPSGLDGNEKLDLIPTDWSIVVDSNRFLLRYAPAIRSYMHALLDDIQDAEDVAQDFFVRVVERGFKQARPYRGRFRDYLKIAVRNAALSHLRRKRQTACATALVSLPAADPSAAANREWLEAWRACLLERAWQALERHQKESTGNLCHSVLRVAIDHPNEDSRTLARRVSAKIGRPLHAVAYRKQLSRARRLFAKLLVREVAQTLDNPTEADIREELAEIGLHDFVVPYLDSAS